MSGSGRTRNWACIVYPESCVDNFLDVLKTHKIPFILSPLHDKDCAEDGSIKKPHFHLMLVYNSVHSYEQAEAVFNSIGGVGCEKVSNMRSYARYLCHLDDLDKYQYNINDVITYGSIDYCQIISLPSDKYQTIGDIMEFCCANSIYSFATLLLYAKDNNEAWFRCMCDGNALIIKEFLKSLSWEDRENRKKGL